MRWAAANPLRPIANLRIRHALRLAAALAIASVIGIGVWYARPIVQARRIGFDWWSIVRASRCTLFQGIEWCTTAAPWLQEPQGPQGPTFFASIAYVRRSRTIVRIERTWTFSDSSAWARLLDSTRRALAADHRSPLPCDRTVTRFPIAEAWRVGDQEIELFAAPRMKLYGSGMRPFLTVILVPFGAGSCGPRYARRLLTPAEMESRARAWLWQQLGFDAQVPTER